MPAKAQATIFQGVKMPMAQSQPLKPDSCSFLRPSNKSTFVMNKTMPPKRLNTLDMTSKSRTKEEKKLYVDTFGNGDPLQV